MMHPRSPYDVTVLYREPTYARHRGAGSRAYRFTFEVEADSVQAAREAALREFEHVARVSGVCWVREVIGTIVAPARRCA